MEDGPFPWMAPIDEMYKGLTLPNITDEQKNIIKEDIVNENEKEDENIKETFEKKRGQLKLLRKKHKRMNKYKKAILKFRLAKKRAFCEAVQKDNEQLFFSNTFLIVKKKQK